MFCLSSPSRAKRYTAKTSVFKETSYQVCERIEARNERDLIIFKHSCRDSVIDTVASECILMVRSLTTYLQKESHYTLRLFYFHPQDSQGTTQKRFVFTVQRCEV